MPKWKEIARYIFFGVCTTLIFMLVFQSLEWVLIPRWGRRSYLFSELVGFIAALVFAFVVNKLFVFVQKSWEPRIVKREAATFTLGRLFSFGLEYLLMVSAFEGVWPAMDGWFTPHWQNFFVADLLPEAFVAEDAFRFIVRWGMIAPFVVSANYAFAKWVVFKKTTPACGPSADADTTEGSRAEGNERDL